jgi:hypothetical protein
MTAAARCPATETAVDGFPLDVQCVRAPGHAPPHHCPHGFHWTDDPGDFTGVCGHCGQPVKLRAVPTPIQR